MSSKVSSAIRALTTVDDDWRPRYGLVLILISSTFICLSAFPSTNWALATAVVLQAATVMATLRASRARPLVMLLALIGTAIGLVAALGLLIAAATGSAAPEARVGTFLITALLVVLSPPVLVIGVWRDIRRRRAVTLQTVFGVISIYLLIGIFFAAVYGGVANLGDEAFFTDGTDGDSQILMYFSFVTLTTLGYGDFAPALALGRTLATVEALIGQVYLVTVIAIVVSNLGKGVLPGDD
ncbi:MAG: potassium channel family protein [Thermoleophilia bacterium]|nr:potassium channel family protein [Thermoleophilia bacterium]MDH3724582.1 potassium channel family protein [Thermoleophilia bacterium]